MWLAISTQPDVSNAVRYVASYRSALRAFHWKATLGILAYINGTSFGLVYKYEGNISGISLKAFAGADYATARQPTRDLYQAEQSCRKVHGFMVFHDAEMCHIFYLLFLTQNVAFGDAVKDPSCS